MKALVLATFATFVLMSLPQPAQAQGGNINCRYQMTRDQCLSYAWCRWVPVREKCRRKRAHWQS